MSKQITITVYEPGDTVETIHGEKLKVIRFETYELKRDKKPLGIMANRILAKSGGKEYWFPVELLKQSGKGSKKKAASED